MRNSQQEGAGHYILISAASATNEFDLLAAFWRRTVNDPLNFVVIPQNIVALYYNCRYMPAISQNKINWLGTQRGQTRGLTAWAGAADSKIDGFEVQSAATSSRGVPHVPWRLT